MFSTQKRTARETRFPAAVALICGLVFSCTGRSGKEPTAKPSVHSKEASAIWVFHPKQKAASTARLPLDGGELEVDRAGSRWLHTVSGAPQPSPFSASEPLVALFQKSGGFAAVGESGTVYLFSSPLGPWEGIKRPPVTYRATRRVGDSLFAVDSAGSLHRSLNFGETWQHVSSAEFFIGVDEGEAGEVIALSVPETWHRMPEKGTHLTRLDVRPMAPRAMVRDELGLKVDGLLASFRWSGGKFVQQEEEKNAPRSPLLKYDIPSFGRASAVRAGHAVLLDKEYLELTPAPQGQRFQLQSAVFGQSLAKVPLSGPGECRRYLFSAYGDELALLCEQEKSSGSTSRLSLYRGSRKGRELKKSPLVLRGDPRVWKMESAPDGSLAISGACPLFAAEQGCQPEGLVWISREGSAHTLTAPAELPRVSMKFDERSSLWLLGARGKDGHLVLVGPLRPGGSPPGLVDLTREAGFHGQSLRPGESLNPSMLLGAESGLVTALGVDKTGARVAVIQADGTVFAVGTPPPGSEFVHGSGQKLLALEARAGNYFESSDGGLSWTRQALPRRLCEPASRDCDLELVCSEAGCLVGDELSRVGWGSESSRMAAEVGPAVAWKNGGEVPPPLTCRVETEDWSSLPGLSEIPGAHHAALGDSAWVQVQEISERAQAVSVRAAWGESQLRTHELLPPVKNPAEYQLSIISQVEGNVALRLPPTSASRISGTQTLSQEKIEIGWDNRITGAAVTMDFLTERNELLSPLGRGRAFRPDLVSIAGDGLYLRLSRVAGDAPTYFLSRTGNSTSTEEAPPLKLQLSKEGWLYQSEIAQAVRQERVRVNGEHAGLLLTAGERIVIQATFSGAEPEYTPYLMGLWWDDSARPSPSVSLSYSGQAVGFVSFLADSDSNRATARFVQLGPFGTFLDPIPVPVQSDLPPKPAACSREERLLTPRVVAPRQAAPRQILVEGLGTSVLVLTTEDAVLHGTPDKPCASAFEAHSPRPALSSEPRYHALWIPGVAQPSWLFRVSSDASGTRQASARPLKCDALGPKAR